MSKNTSRAENKDTKANQLTSQPKENGDNSRNDSNTQSTANGEKPLPHDDHDLWEWKSKYDEAAWKGIRKEAIYLGILFFLSMAVLFLVIMGHLYTWYTDLSRVTPVSLSIFQHAALCVCMGFLGGLIYDIKIFYKALAQGRWHEDRRLWRIATPWVSMALTIVVASMMAEDVFSTNAFLPVVIGFFAGYFSESAIGKLYAIAQLLFG